jgi:hypothetical protein
MTPSSTPSGNEVQTIYSLFGYQQADFGITVSAVMRIVMRFLGCDCDLEGGRKGYFGGRRLQWQG